MLYCPCKHIYRSRNYKKRICRGAVRSVPGISNGKRNISRRALCKKRDSQNIKKRKRSNIKISVGDVDNRRCKRTRISSDTVRMLHVPFWPAPLPDHSYHSTNWLLIFWTDILGNTNMCSNTTGIILGTFSSDIKKVIIHTVQRSTVLPVRRSKTSDVTTVYAL